jgi:hypothetical protein
MPFIKVGGNVVSFAEYSDVLKIDQRVFEANEGLTSTIIEDAAERSTTRILYQIGQTDWWRTYWMRMSGGTYDPLIYTSGLLAIPPPNPNLILDRQDDFTDLCVFYTLSYYIYPKIADFSNEDNAERRKVGFFNEKYRALFQELIDDGSWYDFSDNGTITPNEKMPTRTNIVRVR